MENIKEDSSVQLLLQIKNLILKELQTEKETNISEDILSIVEEIKKLDHDIVPYAQISLIIFSLGDDEKSDFKKKLTDILPLVREKVCELGTAGGKPLTAEYKLFLKIIENLNLAEAQKRFLYKNQQEEILEIQKKYDEINESLIKESKKISDDVHANIDSMQKKYDYISHKLDDEVDKRMNTIYSGFVSVLGIFVSISFTLFGAATLLKNIFTISTSKGFNTSPTVIGSNIMLAGFATLLIYLLLIGLMQSVSSVTKIRYDFSLRRTFIVLFIAMGVIIYGAHYKDRNLNIEATFFNYWWEVVLYLGVGILFYSFGSKIKDFLLRRKQNIKVKIFASIEKNPMSGDNGKITKIMLRLRNESKSPLFINEFRIGNKQDAETLIYSQGIYLLVRQGYKKEFVKNFDHNVYLDESYYKSAKSGKLYAYLHTQSSVIRVKIKTEKNNLNHIHFGSWFRV